MDATVVCPNGHMFQSVFFRDILKISQENSGIQIFSEGNIETCPVCGEKTRVPDLMQQRIGDIVRTEIRNSRLSKESIVFVRDVVESLRSGSTSVEDAVFSLNEVSSGFARAIAIANGNSGLLGLIVGILSLLLAFYQFVDSGSSSEQARNDARALQKSMDRNAAAIEHIAEALENDQEKQRMFDAEIQKLNAVHEEMLMSVSTKRSKLSASRAKSSAMVTGQNRHERRKAAALAKRGRDQSR